MNLRRLALAGTILIAALAGVVSYGFATINSANNKTIALGNGSTTQFTFSFVGDQSGYISVIYTDASGNQTTLTQGTGPTQYQLSLNPAVSPGLWGVGGTVTYDPSGTPIAVGTSLTIVRTLPFVQNISLLNLASLSAVSQAAETGLDQLEMQIQQIAENVNRVVAGPISDPTGLNYTLPPVAQRANLAVCNDPNGNITACQVPSAGIISSAMQPVVDAASLAAGRAAFGLNSAATGQINFGLQQGVSGANNIDANNTPVQDSTNQTVLASFHDTQRICTGPITYTLPRSNATWTGYGFWVYAVSGQCTITPNASDNFQGVASGTAIAVNAGAWVYITTNAASSGTWWVDYHGSSSVNIVAGAAGGAVTFTLNSGPLEFRDTTLANGDPVWSLPANGIAITVPSTATLGSSSNTPNRVYLFAAYNSGTPVLGVAICSSPRAIYGCASWENQRITASQISTGASALGTLYTATAITNDSVIILGYADFCVTASCTAGAWVAPTTITNCLPPRQCRKPGDVIASVEATSGTAATAGANYTPSNALPTTANGALAVAAPSFTAQYVVDRIRVTAGVNGGGSSDANTMTGYLAGGTSVIAVGASSVFSSNSIATIPLIYEGLVASSGGVPSAVVYSGYIIGAGGTFTSNALAGGTSSLWGGSNISVIRVEEIMGSLDPTANDNEKIRMVG